jgi:hypothetical protein
MDQCSALVHRPQGIYLPNVEVCGWVSDKGVGHLGEASTACAAAQEAHKHCGRNKGAASSTQTLKT